MARPRADTGLPESFWSIVACPRCLGRLERQAHGETTCASCEHLFPAGRHGQPDLRAPRYEAGRHPPERPPGPPSDAKLILEPRRPCEVDYSSLRLPPNVSPRFMSLMPRARTGDRTRPPVAVDIGCGSTVCRPLLEHAGYTYVGFDVADERSPLLADAHAIPIRDGVVDVLFSVAALDCLQAPPIALGECYRVLRPGGALVASMPFLTPYTEMSRVHYTHLGLTEVLREAGFSVEVLGTGREWTGLHAISALGLFPRMPRRISNALVLPLLALHRVWWFAGAHRVARPLGKTERLQRIAGDFEFLAVKPI